MSVPPIPRAYEVCDPQEKLQRLSWSYANNRITLKQLEDHTEAALLEEEYYEASRDGLALTPRMEQTKARLDRESEARTALSRRGLYL